MPAFNNQGKFMEGAYVAGQGAAPHMSRSPPMTAALDEGMDMDGLQQAQRQLPQPTQAPAPPQHQQQPPQQLPSTSGIPDAYGANFPTPGRGGPGPPLGLDQPGNLPNATRPRSGALPVKPLPPLRHSNQHGTF